MGNGILIFVLLLASWVFCQDSLWTVEREKIPCKVLEISPIRVVFKISLGSDTGIFFIPAERLARIVFKNGSLETFMPFKSEPAQKIVFKQAMLMPLAPGPQFKPDPGPEFQTFDKRQGPKKPEPKPLGRRAGFLTLAGGTQFNSKIGVGGGGAMGWTGSWVFFRGTFTVFLTNLEASQTTYKSLIFFDWEVGPSIQLVAAEKFRWTLEGGALFSALIFGFESPDYWDQRDQYYEGQEPDPDLEEGIVAQIGWSSGMGFHFRSKRGAGLSIFSGFKSIYTTQFFTLSLALSLRGNK